jgi:virginiamycin B lyase
MGDGRRVGSVLTSVTVLTASALIVAPTLVQPAGAADRLGVITNFAPPSLLSSRDITAGPDGALWFTSVLNVVSRVTTAGTITNFTSPDIGGSDAIATGSDGALWFTITSPSAAIGRITTAGTVTRFSDATISDPGDIASGPDGALWFTNRGNNSIGRITTAGSVSNYDLAGDLGSGSPRTIAAGPDGAVWFTYASSTEPFAGADMIARISTAGEVAAFDGTGIDQVRGIAAGPDGAVWFTNWAPDDSNDSIGRITTSGVVTSFSDPSMREPAAIAAGPDGALWFTNLTGFYDSIGRISTNGVVSNYTDPELALLLSIAKGPDGNMWFTNLSFSIGKIGTDRRFGITTTRLPETWLGAPYSTQLVALDGIPPYRWKRVAGKLPKGLKLDAKTGMIRGQTRRLVGTFRFTIEASYKTKVKGQRAVKHTASQALSIVVNA